MYEYLTTDTFTSKSSCNTYEYFLLSLQFAALKGYQSTFLVTIAFLSCSVQDLLFVC